MMQNKKSFRTAVIVCAAIFLLTPGFVMAYAWGGTLNLEVAALSIAITVIVALWVPKLKWIFAVMASLLIAVPPYPYWTDWDENRGQYFHFFYGYNLQNTPIFTFSTVFLISIALFYFIFSSLDRKETARQYE